MKNINCYFKLFLLTITTFSHLLIGEYKNSDNSKMPVSPNSDYHNSDSVKIGIKPNANYQNSDSRKIGRDPQGNLASEQKNREESEGDIEKEKNCTINAINITKNVTKIINEALDPICFGQNNFKNKKIDLTETFLKSMKSKKFVGERTNKSDLGQNATPEEFKAGLKKALAKKCFETIQEQLKNERISKEVELKGGILKEKTLEPHDILVNSTTFNKLFSEKVFDGDCVEKKSSSGNSK